MRGENGYGILIRMGIIERFTSVIGSDGRSNLSGRLRGRIDSTHVREIRSMGAETKIPLIKRRKITGAERYLKHDAGHLDKPRSKS